MTNLVRENPGEEHSPRLRADAAEARGAFAPLLGPAASGIKPSVSRPMPLMPLPDMMELLSEGDRAAFEAQNDAAHEPVPSAFMDDLEATEAAH